MLDPYRRENEQEALAGRERVVVRGASHDDPAASSSITTRRSYDRRGAPRGAASRRIPLRDLGGPDVGHAAAVAMAALEVHEVEHARADGHVAHAGLGEGAHHQRGHEVANDVASARRGGRLRIEDGALRRRDRPVSSCTSSAAARWTWPAPRASWSPGLRV